MQSTVLEGSGHLGATGRTLLCQSVHSARQAPQALGSLWSISTPELRLPGLPVSYSPLELRDEDLKVHNVLLGARSIQAGAIVFGMGTEEDEYVGGWTYGWGVR